MSSSQPVVGSAATRTAAPGPTTAGSRSVGDDPPSPPEPPPAPRELQDTVLVADQDAVRALAVGIVVAHRHCSPAQAVATLAEIAARTDRSITEVAERLVRRYGGRHPESGRLVGTPTEPGTSSRTT